MMDPKNRKTRRPLAGRVKSAANKLLSRRLERKRLKRDLAAGYPLPGYCGEE